MDHGLFAGGYQRHFAVLEPDKADGRLHRDGLADHLQRGRPRNSLASGNPAPTNSLDINA